MNFVKPQLAHRGKGFGPSLLDDPAYVGEQKLDGQRAQIHIVDHRTTAVHSRTGKEKEAPGFAWLYDVVWKVREAVLDGEVNSPGAVSSDVGHLLSVGGTTNFGAFDVLSLGGKSIMRREYTYRRAVLEEIVRVQGHPQILATKMSADKRALLAEVTKAGGEGIIMKRVDSPYIPGSRTQAWVKLHSPKRAKTYSVVITGVTDKATYSREAFKTGDVAWTYGVYDPKTGQVKTVGQIGKPGDRDEKERHVGRVLEVEAKLMFKGGGLRHGHVLGFRDDLRPQDCRDGQ